MLRVALWWHRVSLPWWIITAFEVRTVRRLFKLKVTKVSPRPVSWTLQLSIVQHCWHIMPISFFLDLPKLVEDVSSTNCSLCLDSSPLEPVLASVHWLNQWRGSLATADCLLNGIVHRNTFSETANHRCSQINRLSAVPRSKNGIKMSNHCCWHQQLLTALDINSNVTLNFKSLRKFKMSMRWQWWKFQHGMLHVTAASCEFYRRHGNISCTSTATKKVM